MGSRTRVEVGGVLWWLGRNAEPEATTRLIGDALEAMRSGAAQDLKSGRRKQLYPLDLRGSGKPDHLLKVNEYRVMAGLRRRLHGSKARQELEIAEQVADRGIPTVAPCAAGEQRSEGRLRRCYLLVPILTDALDLRRIWKEGSLAPGERRALVSAFGLLTRQIHDAGVFQEDFAPNNFLVRRGRAPQLFMIDFERAELRRSSCEAARRLMLAKLDRELAGAPVGDRMRFLLAYGSGSRDEARAWWRHLEAFAPTLAQRDFARIRRNATRSGRRFRRVAHGAWRGFARTDVDDALLLEGIPETRVSRAAVHVQPVGRLWRVHYGGVHRSEGRRIWVTANFLWKRGQLCPRPLGVWTRRGETVLLLERRSGAVPLSRWPDPGPALTATRVLLGRVLALAEIREGPEPDGILIATKFGEGLTASLLVPHGVRVSGSTVPQRRERLSELVSPLGEKCGEEDTIP